MGLFFQLLGKLFYPLLFTGACTYYAFSLGSELAVAARRAGRSLGMGYLYFKVTLKVLTFIIFIYSISLLNPSKRMKLLVTLERQHNRPTHLQENSSTQSAKKESKWRKSSRSSESIH